ncbi:Per1-domain-containing protein [Xylariaceae sp. FL0804]|nr:Per1-domain-containing protein [Xylariaceae sp. FL0804]
MPRSSLTGSLPLRLRTMLLAAAVLCLLLAGRAEASLGDRLPEFRECVEVCARENCDPNHNPTSIPLHRRLLLWTCPQECDYTCQHIVTASRATAGEPTTQFHGKWPFARLLGVQEPCSVLFSLGNLLAHAQGLREVRRAVPPAYPLRPFYVAFARFGAAAWVASALFHTRDFAATEQADYFAAGASVLYGLYFAVVRVFRLDLDLSDRRGRLLGGSGGGSSGGGPSRLLPVWTATCLCLYLSHVAYLKLGRWDYTYNMAANVAVGLLQNSLWTYLSWRRWRQTRQPWAVWPAVIVAWLLMAMGLELLDFPPLWGALDAHSLWHLGTIAPTILWYRFMVKDSLDDLAHTTKLKDIKG